MSASFRLLPSMRLMLLGVAAMSVMSGCSRGDDDRLAGELAPPERVDVLSPPVAPDVSEMHPALQIARSRGLKTNVYFNEELQQAVARLGGMQETLGRLQNDLQGTAMAMQRVEMMRQEIDALNVRFQSLQERLVYAGPVLGPVPEGAMQTTTTVETTSLAPAPGPDGVTSMTIAPLDNQTMPPANTMPGPMSMAPNTQPTSLMGDMAKPPVAEAPKTAQMKPVMDDKGASAKPAKASSASTASSGPGVAAVRIGEHADSERIVLDVNGANSSFKADIDSAENMLTVELPNTKWSAAGTQTVKGNALIASYSAQPSGDGSVVVFSLKGSSKVLKTSTLKSPTRIVIDLAR